MTEAVIALVLSFLGLVCAFRLLLSDEPPKTLKQVMDEDAEEQRYHEWYGEPHGESRPRARCREEDLIARGASPHIRLEKHHLG